MASSSEFSLFPQLPAEIRLAIWTLCLPRRVLTIDRVFCQRTGTTRIRHFFFKSPRFVTVPPVLSRVCREARDQAFRDSGYASNHIYRSSDVFGHQPKIDILYLRARRENLTESRGLEARIDIINNAAHSGRLCMSKDILFPPIEDFSRITTWNTRYRTYYQGRLSHIHQFQARQVVVEEFSFGLPEQAARQSGLFGLLGDEPIQLLDPNDMETMGRMRCLLNYNRTHDSRGWPLFNTALEFLHCVKMNSTTFRRNIDRLRANLMKLWVCFCWCRDLTKDGTTRGLGIDEVWVPGGRQQPDTTQFKYARSPRSQWWGEIGSRQPNMENPWVAEVVAEMPVFHLKIMLRASFTK